MWGMVTEAELEAILRDKMAETRERIELLETSFNERMRRIGLPPTPNELAQEALKKILEQVNPREFVENLLVTKGLTLESLVRQAVADGFGTYAKGLEDGVVEDIADRAWNDLDLDDLSSKVADRLVKIVWAEAKGEIIDAVVDKLADEAWENFDMDELYPHIGERVVNRMTAERQ